MVIRRLAPLVAIILSISSQNAYSAGCNDGFAVLGGPFSVFGMVNGVEVADWRKLVDDTFRVQMLDQALTEGLSQCPNVKAGQVVLMHDRRNLVVAWTMLNPRHWTIVRDDVLAEIQREDAEAARVRADQQHLESEAQARKAEAEAKEKRRLAVLADCGDSPVISGGPWFSSTYKVGALDEARNQTGPRFVCVKEIEYIGRAVNPFGGNAARATFTGFQVETFQPIAVTLDFPY